MSYTAVFSFPGIRLRGIPPQTETISMTRRSGHGLAPTHFEYVSPRGPFRYSGRVRILVDHWTGSAADGFAMGLEAMDVATVVGTKMMGLGAAIAQPHSPHSIRTHKYQPSPYLILMGAHASATCPRSLSI